MRRLHPKKIDDAVYYERIWSAEYNSRPYYDTVRQLALAKFVKDGNKIADFGAGCFGTAQFIAQNQPERSNCYLYAIDQSYTAKTLVLDADYRSGTKIFQNPRFHYVLSACEDTPFRDQFFDCVISGELIEHYENPQELVDELIRVCKVGGWITLTTVDTKCEDAIRHGEYPEHVWEFEPEELRQYFSYNCAVAYSLVGDYHFIEARRTR